jgi:flavin reductase (DIM6/NTAB) family NADH-FMN oxidoreductase RutF
MKKVKLGASSVLFPMPIVIVGTNVAGKPNYSTVAWCNIVEQKPAMLMIASNKSHYTNKGIKEYGTFSINIPSESLMEKTDYVGIYSGNKIDKSKVFQNFYGILETAPMVEECSVNLECKLVKTIDLEIGHEIFIGKIEEVYVNQECLTNGLPDISKVKPLAFGNSHYWSLGEELGKAFSVGKFITK